MFPAFEGLHGNIIFLLTEVIQHEQTIAAAGLVCCRCFQFLGTSALAGTLRHTFDKWPFLPHELQIVSLCLQSGALWLFPQW